MSSRPPHRVSLIAPYRPLDGMTTSLFVCSVTLLTAVPYAVESTMESRSMAKSSRFLSKTLRSGATLRVCYHYLCLDGLKVTRRKKLVSHHSFSKKFNEACGFYFLFFPHENSKQTPSEWVILSISHRNLLYYDL